MYFSKRLLMYETNSSSDANYDYGEVSQVITDKLINVNMGGSNYTLEAVAVESGYIPKVGDWVVIEWQNGNPVAKGSNGIAGGYGLNDINTPVIVAQSDLASGTINSDHIRSESIEARHIQAGSITADAISANTITSDKIAANTITGDNISANTITGDKIQANTITSDNIRVGGINGTSISANSITSVQLQANSVTAVQISANAVQTQHISANTITSQMIKADAINATHISANSITSDEIQANAIQTQHISANSVQASQISANSVQTQHISANTITTSQIQAGAITATLISANQVNATHISANSVTATAISANAVQTQHISANTITTSQIKAGAITSNLISANQVNATHISANQVNATHISANSVQASHISANSVQTQHISANSIQGYQISANQISANHITANAITAVAISSNSIQARHISANSIQANMISANQVNATHISANSVLSNMISANQVQAQHISANSIQSQHISANSVQAQHISANSIQTQHISANTILGYQISANQISGNHIVAGTISANQLAVGTVQQGLLGQYYTYTANAVNKFLTFKGSQIDPTINFSWGTGSPSIVGQSDYFAVRWQGFITPPESGQYNFAVNADDTFKLVIGATTVINTGYTSGNEITGNSMTLTQGTWYPILAEMTEGTGGSTAILKWIRPSLIKEVIPSAYLTQGNTQIDGAQILTGTITATSMQVGTITAQSGILANASITTANIASGNITSALIGNGEIKTANIASGNITNALIKDSTIDHAKIASVDASTITVGQLDGTIIKAGTISGGAIIAQSITGDRIKAGDIDTTQLKAGSVVTDTIAAGAVTTDRIEAGAVTGDIIRAGSITAEHISTVGLDAQLIQVYNSKTGETLVGSGYLRVDGLDVGVVQSDNLLQNGLFLASSSDYGYKRINPSGEALLGNTVTGLGSHQIWKIDLTSGSVVKTIDIPAKKPFDIAIHPTGNYAYITVQGDNTLVQLDLAQDTLTTNMLGMGMGPARIKWRDMDMDGMDMKHMFVLNTDPDDMNIPDTISIVDTPPSSVNGDLYVHHEVVLGNNPYDFVMDDSTGLAFVTMASEGDIVVLDTNSTNSFNWKIKGRIPVSAFGTDNLHGDLPAQIGLNEVVGGDASSQYNADMSGMSMSSMGGMDTMGYGASDGSLRTYAPHGIALSSDPDTLYVVDYDNGELLVVDKWGNAPYNYLVGTTAQGSFTNSSTMQDMSMGMTSGGMMMGTSPASLKNGGEIAGGGPGTYYVRYRIPVGDSPDFVEVVNGKIFITLGGSNDIAVIDENAIISEINADKAYYGTKNDDGSFSNWDTSMMMRTVTQPTIRMIMGVGTGPSFMKVSGMNLYVTLSGDNKIIKIDTDMEMINKTYNVGTNPKGFDITPDGKYMYVANYGGVGDLSFIYPNGAYIGDPYMALEGGIMYQGADGWTPDRSDWVYDASGNVQSKSTVEFHINEPLKNEGGYAKLTTYGIDSQYAQIEQDIMNVDNYSNGNNTVVVTGGALIPNYDNTVFTPREGSFISGSVSNVKIGKVVSGNNVLTNASGFTINYNTSQISFSANAVPSGNWVVANYTSPNNIYYKTQNSSVEIAVDNGSSPNFSTSFQVDEFVPNFVVVDNRQTSSFTPTADGINDTYEGLYYSVATNRAVGTTVTTSVTPISGSASKVTDNYEPDEIEGDVTMNPTPPTDGSVTLPSGNQWVKVDLGNVYMVGKISVAHSYGLDRTYHKTKTEVSEDGVNWTTIYDSAVSGEYNEKPFYHTQHGHTHYAHFFTFNALPVRYVRDWASGWTSGDGLTSGNTSDWTEIKAYGDWEVEKGYTYPSNSNQAGQQVATNGIGFVSTDISKAYVSMNIQINFTSWWWMTYIVGPDFGRIKIEMPTLMNSGHFLNQQAPYINNVAHRHIMTFPPSAMVQSDSMNSIEGGKHRVIIRQDSGKVTLDRLRFDDFQYYNRSTLSIPSQSSSATFTRYKVIAEQAKWYQGKGRQSTEGAYDTPRTNPDTGLRDYSVPIKYRVRVLSQLSPTGASAEAGTIYVTSAIFETGKQSTHWRRSEASDVFPASKIQQWNPNSPFNTGIQSSHLANGSVRGTKILANTLMDYHVSNYARIQEHKLELNYPTHGHTNKAFLDTMTGFAGISGNYGTGNTVARGDHKHDYLPLSGGATVTGSTTFNSGVVSKAESHFSNGTYADPSIGSSYGLKVSQGIATDKLNVSGSVTVTGNITITGTVDGVDVSNLNSSYSTTSGNVTNHIGSGGNAHPVATSGSAGFMGTADRIKLDAIQTSSINQTTGDTMYARLSGNNLNNTVIGKLIEHQRNALILGNNDWTPLIYSTTGGKAYYNSNYKGVVLSGNSTWVKVRTRLPIDPESTYFLRAKVTKNMGSGSIYIGADTLDNNYNSLATDQAQSYNYFGASSVTITSGNSQYFESTISGYNTTSGSNRNMFDPSGSYFDLVLIANYSDTSGIGQTTFEWIELYKAPNTGYIGSSLIATQTWVTGNYYNQSTSDSRYLSATGGALNGNLSVTGNITVTGTVDGIDVSSLSSSVATISGNLNTTNSNVATISGNLNTTNSNIATLSGNIVTVSGNLSTTNTNLANLSANVSTISGNLNTTNNNVANISGNLNTTNTNVSTLSGNIVTVSGNLNTTNNNVSTISGNLNSHIGSGGSAHAVVTTGSNGFMSYNDKSKLDGISANAINQSYADTRYFIQNQNMNLGAYTLSFNANTTGGTAGIASTDYGSIYGEHDVNTENSRLVIDVSDNSNDSIVLRTHTNSSTPKNSLVVSYGSIVFSDVPTVSGNGTLATQPWVTGNYYTQTYLDSILIDATESTHGFMSTSDKVKLDGISSNAMNQSNADNRYLQLTGGALSGGLSVTGNITLTGTVDGVDVSSLNSSFGTVSANVTNHIGSGGNAHAVVTTLSNGFMSYSDKTKLDGIQSSAINQTSADTRYLQLTGGALSGGLSVTGNITVTGTVDGVDVSALNSSYSTTSGNVTNHIGSSGNSHATVTSGGSAGFMSGTDKAKLDGIQSNAINQLSADVRYLQLTGGTLSSDLNLNGQLVINQYNAGIQFNLGAFNNNVSGSQWWHGPSGSGDNILQIIKGGSGNSNYSWYINGSDLVWTQKTLGTDPATKTWISGNYYNQSTVSSMVNARGDVFASGNNTFGNLNTFTNAGMSIKIQPSASVGNTTKLLQMNNAGGSEIFSVNYSGGVTIAGDFTVTGQQVVSGTTSVNGDYTISGQLVVGGNSTLGDSSTDVTTVNGTLKVSGNIEQIGSYEEVHRRPLYGIAGDLQFQTDSTTFDTIVDFYDLSLYALPTVQTGATRYYRLYVVYGDDITSTQASAGQKATIRIAGSTNKDIDLPYTWGTPNGRRDWYSAYFTDLPTGNGNLQAMLAQSGNSLGIRWIEVIAYDKF